MQCAALTPWHSAMRSRITKSLEMFSSFNCVCVCVCVHVHVCAGIPLSPSCSHSSLHPSTYCSDLNGSYLHGLIDLWPIPLTLCLCHLHYLTSHHHNLKQHTNQSLSYTWLYTLRKCTLNISLHLYMHMYMYTYVYMQMCKKCVKMTAASITTIVLPRARSHHSRPEQVQRCTVHGG